MIIELLLLLSLFGLFYSLLIGQFPETTTVKEKIKVYVLPLASALAFFFLGKIIFLSALSGMIFAVLGWFLPKWILHWQKKQRKKRPRELAKDFITGAAGIFGAGQVTEEVIRQSAKRFPEPFSSDFQEMLARRNLDSSATYPLMFRQMANKYGLKEFQAVAAIIEASNQAGGPLAASRGLKKLSIALQKRDKQLMERQKANMEPQIACFVAIVILSVGLILDVTVFRDLYEQSKTTLAAGCLVVVGLIFAVVKLSDNTDLE